MAAKIQRFLGMVLHNLYLFTIFDPWLIYLRLMAKESLTKLECIHGAKDDTNEFYKRVV